MAQNIRSNIEEAEPAINQKNGFIVRMPATLGCLSMW